MILFALTISFCQNNLERWLDHKFKFDTYIDVLKKNIFNFLMKILDLLRQFMYCKVKYCLGHIICNMYQFVNIPKKTKLELRNLVNYLVF